MPVIVLDGVPYCPKCMDKYSKYQELLIETHYRDRSNLGRPRPSILIKLFCNQCFTWFELDKTFNFMDFAEASE